MAWRFALLRVYLFWRVTLRASAQVSVEALRLLSCSTAAEFWLMHIIGAAVGLFGGLLTYFVSEAAISPFQVYSSMAFGAVTILIGGWLIWKTRKPSCECNIPTTPINGKRFGRVDAGAFTLGLNTGISHLSPTHRTTPLRLALLNATWAL